MSKNYLNISIKASTQIKLKKMKEVHDITYDELINDLISVYRRS